MRTGQTVIVAKDLVTMSQRTTLGTIARITGPGFIDSFKMPGWFSIETTDHKLWTVPEKNIVPAPRPWSWYQRVHPHADNEPEQAALKAAGAI
jgi:hypothetical protein